MKTKENINENSLKIIKDLILKTLNYENSVILLFGSRARGDFNKYSDIDIGIIPDGHFDRRKLILLKEKLEDLNIPYKVEFVDLSKVSDIFRKKAFEEGKIWKS